MENLSAFVSLTVFIGIIVVIIFEWIHLTVAAFLGALILIFTQVVSLNEAVNYISKAHQTLALFFGVMVLIRSFEPTKVFDYLGTKIVIFAKGEGRRVLLGIVAITTPICAFLPNATTVMLLAPLVPTIAAEIGVDFVPLLILMVFIANSSGLLTLVGDPATFIVGNSINLVRLSAGGAIAVLVVVAILPILFRKIWNKKITNLQDLPHPEINHPRVLMVGIAIVAGVLIFFVIGGELPTPISPAAVALMGAALALLLAHQSKIDSVNNILRDVDWSTLLFFMCIFVSIGSLEKTGVIGNLSGLLAIVLGKNIALGSIVLLFIIGLFSSVVPNIPLVAAMLPLLKEYLVKVGLVGGEVLNNNFTGQFPAEVLPLFYAMMYGATLGGNGTLVGASSNIVAAGVAELHGKSISFHSFLRYGVPVTILQLVSAALYVTFAFLI
jgi:Na+/H+ antiporter NhaD/arsenite permease-like protein